MAYLSAGSVRRVYSRPQAFTSATSFSRSTNSITRFTFDSIRSTTQHDLIHTIMATQTNTSTALQPARLLASSLSSINNVSPPVTHMARPYKAFLTPSLHRRFARAYGTILILCWAESFLMSDASWFWSWFPFSLTGVRTLILSIPCLAIFIIRLQNLHIGKQTTTSDFETLVQHLTGSQIKSTVFTVLWYIFSAFFFGEIYIWTRSHDASLGWIDPGKAYERSRANENPVFLRAFYVLLGLVQAGLHIARDGDRLELEELAAQSRAAGQAGASPKPDVLQRLLARKSTVLQYSINATLITLMLNIPTYFIFTRGTLWTWNYWMAERLTKHLQPNNGPVGLINLGGLIWQTFSSSFLLLFLWQASNATFSVFLAEDPLKKGLPLTNEIKDARGVVISRSKDPNWSLIRGLSSSKELPKSFAFWELKMIAQDFPDRRKTIFTEVDRSDRPKSFGSTWSHISKACLEQIAAISHRIQVAQQPVESKAEAQKLAEQKKQHENLIAAEIQQKMGLPKIADQQVHDDRAVMQKSSGIHSLGSTVGGLAKSIGQSPGGVNPVVPYARKAITFGADRAFSKEVQAHLKPEAMKKDVSAWVFSVLRSPIGTPFRQTFSRRACAVVLGVPHSNKVNIIHGTKALVKLTMESLREDDFGQVAKDISVIVRTLTSAIQDIAKLIGQLEPHWTDVEFHGSRRTKDVEEVFVVLRDGLEEIILGFGEYAGAIGLTKKELREAREAVGSGSEMQQARG